MRNFLNKLLSRFGYTLYSKKSVEHYTISELAQMHGIDAYDVAYIKGKLDGGLKDKLIREGRTKWLDIGCGGNFEENFYYLDTFPEGAVSEKDKYYRTDIVNISSAEVDRIGKFDFIRMQHVFEHFTPENGLKVLENCARLLKDDGYILITTPDLKRYVHLYLADKIKDLKENTDWSVKRIEKDSPNSFYFSVFSHSMLYESHEWCYDAEGIIYQLSRSGKYKNIREIKLDDPLANIPFTHNRPYADVCVIAQLN